jgi:hypothetical protein
MGEAWGGDRRPAETGRGEPAPPPQRADDATARLLPGQRERDQDPDPDPVQQAGREKAGRGRREGKLDLNLPQVAGSAVAAVVAAKLASNLGVYGTIAGAGVVSVLGTCGGTILQHVFRRTGRHMQEVAGQARPGVRRVRDRARPSAGAAPATAAEAETAARTLLLPDAVPEADTGTRQVAVTAPLTGAARGASGHHVESAESAESAEHGQSGGAGRAGQEGYGAPTAYRARGRAGWKRPAVAVALAFGLTMAGITGYEAVAGESIGGGHGTTIGNAVTGHSSSRSGGGHVPAPGSSGTASTGDTSSPYGSDVGGRPRKDTTPTATSPATGNPSAGTGTGAGQGADSGSGAGTGGAASGTAAPTPATPTAPATAPTAPPTSAAPSPTPSQGGDSLNGSAGSGVQP